MSKINDFQQESMESNRAILINLFNEAIENKDLSLYAQATSYAEGLIDAYDAFLSNERTSIEKIIQVKTMQFSEVLKDG